MVTAEAVAAVYGSGFALTLGFYMVGMKVGAVLSALRKL